VSPPDPLSDPLDESFGGVVATTLTGVVRCALGDRTARVRAWRAAELPVMWLSRLLALTAPATPTAAAVRVKALSAAGALAWGVGESDEAPARYEAALALARAAGDASATGWALVLLQEPS
jgi:hypothetical protein